MSATPEQVKAWRQRVRAAARLNPTIIPHGTANGYMAYGCRCTPCTDANTVKITEWRARHGN